MARPAPQLPIVLKAVEHLRHLLRRPLLCDAAVREIVNDLLVGEGPFLVEARMREPDSTPLEQHAVVGGVGNLGRLQAAATQESREQPTVLGDAKSLRPARDRA